MAERSTLGGGDGSNNNNLDEAQPSPPTSVAVRKNRSRPRLVRRSTKTTPELNKNCNHPNAPSIARYNDPQRIENLLNRGKSLFIEEDDAWYNTTEGDYLEGCAVDEEDDDAVGCASTTSIYARDEALETALVPTLMSLDVSDDRATGLPDGGEFLTDRVNQLLQEKGANGSFPYRRPLGHVDEPIGVQLMSNSFTLSADDMADRSRPGIGATADSELSPSGFLGEGPAGDACELVALDDFGPDLDDESSEDDVESSDGGEDSDSGEENCEEEEEEVKEEKTEDEEQKDDLEENISAESTRSSENLRNVINLNTIDGMIPVACNNALCIQGSTEVACNNDDSDDSFEDEDEDAEEQAPCTTEEETGTVPYSKVKNEASEENAMSQVWNRVVEGARYSSNLITKSLSNSDLDDSSDSGEDDDEEEDEEKSHQVEKGRIEISQSEVKEEECHIESEANEPEPETNTPAITTNSPNVNNYTSIKEIPTKNGAYNYLLKQTDQGNKQNEDTQTKKISTPRIAPPVLTPKVNLKSQFGKTPTAEMSTKTDAHNRTPKEKDHVKQQEENRQTKKTLAMRKTQQNAKATNLPSRVTLHSQAGKIARAKKARTPSPKANKREAIKRVNMAAILSSKAKASMKKPVVEVRSETNIDHSRSGVKKTKSSMFERRSYIKHDREHNRKEASVFRNDDHNDWKFSRHEIPKEGKFLKEGRAPKESGSSVDPIASPTKDPLPPNPVSKASEIAKKQAMLRNQQWRPRSGAASKQLVSLNENANKPSSDIHSAIEQSLGPSIDLTTESTASNLRERERIRRKMLAFKTESSGGVARVFQVGNTPSEEEVKVKPIQMNRIYDESHKVPKIAEPTVIPEAPKAWYNPMRWLSGSSNQKTAPIIEAQAALEENIEALQSLQEDKPTVKKARGPAPLPKPKPKQPRPYIGDGGHYPLPVQSDPKPSREVRRYHGNTANDDLPMVKRYHGNTANDEMLPCGRDDGPEVREAWKEASEKLRQERKQRLQLLKQEGIIKTKEKPKEVVPEKSVGYVPGRGSKKRIYKPQNVSNGSAVEEREPEQPKRMKPKAYKFNRKQVDNNGNNCRSEVMVKSNASNNNNNNNIDNDNTNTNRSVSSIKVGNYDNGMNTPSKLEKKKPEDANNSSDREISFLASRLEQCAADGEALAAPLDLLLE